MELTDRTKQRAHSRADGRSEGRTGSIGAVTVRGGACAAGVRLEDTGRVGETVQRDSETSQWAARMSQTA